MTASSSSVPDNCGGIEIIKTSSDLQHYMLTGTGLGG